MTALFEIKKAFFGASPARLAISELEQALFNREKATLLKEQAEFDVKNLALNIQRQTLKVERIVADLREGAMTGRLTKREIKLATRLIGDVLPYPLPPQDNPPNGPPDAFTPHAEYPQVPGESREDRTYRIAVTESAKAKSEKLDATKPVTIKGRGKSTRKQAYADPVGEPTTGFGIGV